MNTLGDQSLERTLDDSAIRRILIPDIFLLADAILTIFQVNIIIFYFMPNLTLFKFPMIIIIQMNDFSFEINSKGNKINSKKCCS